MQRRSRAAAWAATILIGLAAARSQDALAQASCREVAFSRPFAGEPVRGVVPILGSARIDGFGFYKIEWASAAEPEDWKAVSTTYATPVVHGLLDEWDTRSRPDGEYDLRLVVVDQSGQEPCRQVVQRVLVANDRPTELGATSTVTPTVALLAARPGELPPVDARATTASAATATFESLGEAATTTDGTTDSLVADFSDLVRPDHPVELVRPGEAEAAGSEDGATQPLDVLDPSQIIAAVGLDSWPRAFAAGAIAALLLATFLLVVIGLRRPR